MGMRGGLFPAQTQAHLIQQAQMARMQAQRHQHTQVCIGLAQNSGRKWSNILRLNCVGIFNELI